MPSSSQPLRYWLSLLPKLCQPQRPSWPSPMLCVLRQVFLKRLREGSRLRATFHSAAALMCRACDKPITCVASANTYHFSAKAIRRGPTLYQRRCLGLSVSGFRVLRNELRKCSTSTISFWVSGTGTYTTLLCHAILRSSAPPPRFLPWHEKIRHLLRDSE